MSFIWATRGKSWGFRFLATNYFADPLPEYESMFTGDETDAALFKRTGAKVGLRFPDPLDRKDASGRRIPHEFVVFPPLADEITSLEQGIETIWPIVADTYADAWARVDTSPDAEHLDRIGGTVLSESDVGSDSSPY